MEKLTPSLEENLRTFRELFHAPENQDFVVRELEPGGVRLAVLCIDGMASRRNIESAVLRPLMKAPPFGSLPPETRAQALLDKVLPTGTGETEKRVQNIAEFLLDGNCAVLIDGCAQAVLAETQGYDTRSVNQPLIENTAFASHEAFNESLRTNLTLLRRILRTPDLVAEMHNIGATSSTKVALVYLSGVTSRKLIAECRRRLSGVGIDRLLSVGQLQQLIEDNPRQLLPQIVQTERPDRTASFLTDGMAVVLCDGAPYALAMPGTFWTFLHTPDDHALRWQYGSFLRIVRVLGFFLALLLPALYNALLLYHQELLPMDLLTSILEGYTLVPLSVTLELFLMDFVFDLINEASLRMPGDMGSALGIVGGLVLGQAAVSANLISPLLIIIVSVAGLGLFSVPSYPLSLALRIARLFLLLASTLAGFAGIAVALALLLCAGCAMESFGTPYFAPAVPAMRHNGDLFWRFPERWQQKRPGMAHPQKPRRTSAPRGWEKGGEKP